MGRTIPLDPEPASNYPEEIQLYDPQLKTNYKLKNVIVHIGHDDDNEISIACNPHISDTHARIQKNKDKRWTIEDLKSTNGTKINHRPIIKTYLAPGDLITLANHHLIFSPSRNIPMHTLDDFIHKLGICATAPQTRAAFEQAFRYARTKEHILIQGPTGAGKDILARFIHTVRFDTDAAERPMIILNMSAMPETLAEMELFGAKKGSFTGAIKDSEGLFESARNGTLFLDEIGDLPLALQPKLLRVIENREIRRIGESQTRTVECACIFATHQNLKEKIEKKQFREDLYHRICVLPVTLPALKERPEEIIPIAQSLLPPQHTISEKAQKKLLDYAYPGNIRELKNIVTRARVMATSDNRNELNENDIMFI